VSHCVTVICHFVPIVSGILDPFWALPYVGIATTYINTLICFYRLVYNKIRDDDNDELLLDYMISDDMIRYNTIEYNIT